jgi:hypothetical protein
MGETVIVGGWIEAMMRFEYISPVAAISRKLSGESGTWTLKGISVNEGKRERLAFKDRL